MDRLVPHSGQHVIEIAALLAEIDSLRAQIVILQKLADTDPLCALSNRRAFNRELERAILMKARHDTPAALALMDVDGLKKINDDAGHVAGDRLLSHIASRMRAAFRQTDIVARIGGDEFALLLPYAGLKEADARLTSFSADLAHDLIQVGQKTVSARLSSGLTLIRATDSPEAAMARADEAMYRVKRAQRSER